MFSTMVHELKRGSKPDPGLLEKRFDAAMTKKLGVVRLPPAFWTDDPKINPRSDHLFWASLLIGDRQRVDLAISAVAVELEQKIGTGTRDLQLELAVAIQQLVGNFLETVSETDLRQSLEDELPRLLPEYFQDNSEMAT